MRLSCAEAARIVSGAVVGPPDLRLTGAEVDSRRVRPGDLFVALRGARSDGHAFVADAIEVATAALVRFDAELDPIPPDRALIRVEDPLEAYWKLAARVRADAGWRVAAVTGSVGKTTTKNMLASLLDPAFTVGATTGNRNSTLGLPAEMLSQPAGVEVFVAEAGMSRAGELDTIGALIAPQLVLYTRIAPVHTEFFADLEAVARAKAELIPHLDPAGTLVVNADDPLQRAFPAATSAAVLRYGAADADAEICDLEDRGLLGTRFTLRLPSGRARVDLALAGRHQAENLLAAATAAAVFGIGADGVAAVAPRLEPAPRRGRVHTLAAGVTLVDDSYNASPVAMRRLLELLAVAPGRRVAVLGEMFELGERSAEAHREVGRAAASACDLLVATGGAAAGELAAAARDAGLEPGSVHHVADAEAAAELLARVLEPADVVLIKGSRGVGLDRTVDALLGREAA
ncbi:MAG: UDP-N-acetylmuramoyl-tripeptide--D-alanyl-D-alanine ligase [Thermoanaerobaculales bacterium]|nr:UDP-N-acetylmuramoyl-tripeptide--D-alanyl-D-alanine ligase [Thermoanaerobaculales bacterium]